MNKRKAQIQPATSPRGSPRALSLERYGFDVERFPRYVNQRYRPHVPLDFVLLSVIVGGRGRHVLGDEVHRETGGSVAVTHYGQDHDIVTDARGMDVYNVYLDLRNHPLPTLPESLRPILSAILPVHPRMQHHLNRRVWTRIDRPELLAAGLARIEQEIESDQPGARAIVQHSFQIFLIDVCRAAQQYGLVPATPHQAQFPAWVERLRRDIDRGFAGHHELAPLAKQAGVSIAYLCRVFKKYTGRTVTEYLVERRIQAAIWKLREAGDEKIISIALGCGFNDLAYFNRVFKRIMKTTPSGYRQQMRSKEATPPLRRQSNSPHPRDRKRSGAGRPARTI